MILHSLMAIKLTDNVINHEHLHSRLTAPCNTRLQLGNPLCYCSLGKDGVYNYFFFTNRVLYAKPRRFPRSCRESKRLSMQGNSN